MKLSPRACLKILKGAAAGLLPVACVGSAVTAHCGDAPASPPWPQSKSLAAAPFRIFRQVLNIFLALFLLASVFSTNVYATAFTYQGRLNNNGATANGAYDVRFILFDVAEFGFPAAKILTNSNIQVSDGFFTTTLDFGDGIFTGSNYWLEIAVRTNGSSGVFTTLTPRQMITAVPYAVYSANAATALTANTASAVSGAGIIGTIPDSRLSTNVAMLNGNVAFSGTVTASNFNFTGGGMPNVSGSFRWLTITQTTVQAQANTGYLLTNPREVTVNLPGSPTAGDTVRILGLGLEGWRVTQNVDQYISSPDLHPPNWTGDLKPRAIASSYDGNRLVAASDLGFLYTSTNGGKDWIKGNLLQAWTGVASSSDGMKLAAVAPGYIYTSWDAGNTWIARETNRFLAAIASSASGNKLVAVVYDGQIYTSTDSGVTWVPRDTNRSWNGVASSADGTKLVAITYDGQIYTSTDSGVTWTARETNRKWTYVACSSDGNKLVATAFGDRIYTSSNAGLSWVPRESMREWYGLASSGDGSKLVTSANGQIFLSTDSGMTWTLRKGMLLYSIASSFDGTRLIANGWNMNPDWLSLVRSTDSGETWSIDAPRTTIGTEGSLAGRYRSTVELIYVGDGQWVVIRQEGSLTAY